MTETAKRVWAYVKKQNLLEQGDTVVTGVSGGADSVCLLLILLELRETLSFKLSAVHVHHGIREEADGDETFVRGLCARLGVPCRVFHEDVPAFARAEGLSEEEAGRELRYRDFETELWERMRAEDEMTLRERMRAEDETALQEEIHAEDETELRERMHTETAQGKIAVAHHADDRAETLLFHLFRGTGLAGMGGIRPRRGNIVRPLLELSRQEIEEYLKKQDQPWRTDATNEGDAYTRNKIRHHILPYVEEQICRGAGAHLAQEAQLLADTADYMRRQSVLALERCLAPGQTELRSERRPSKAGEVRQERRRFRLSVSAFRREEELLQSLLLHECLCRLGCQKDMTSKDVTALRHLFLPSCQSGRGICVSGVKAVREFGTVTILRTAARGGETVGLRIPTAVKTFESGPPIAAESVGSGSLTAAGTPTPAGISLPQAGISLPQAGAVSVPGLGEVNVRLLAAAKLPDFLEKIPQNRYTKWFDYDKIIQSVRLRTRRPGDYLTVDGALHRKKLQDYLIAERVPADERDTLVLLADGAHIMWVPGHRISAAYKVTEQTQHILEIYVRGGTE